MSVYVAIMEGSSPESIQPILTTRDPEILRAVSRAIERRIREDLEDDVGSMRQALELVQGEAQEAFEGHEDDAP